MNWLRPVCAIVMKSCICRQDRAGCKRKSAAHASHVRGWLLSLLRWSLLSNARPCRVEPKWTTRCDRDLVPRRKGDQVASCVEASRAREASILRRDPIDQLKTQRLPACCVFVGSQVASSHSPRSPRRYRLRSSFTRTPSLVMVPHWLKEATSAVSEQRSSRFSGWFFSVVSLSLFDSAHELSAGFGQVFGTSPTSAHLIIVLAIAVAVCFGCLRSRAHLTRRTFRHLVRSVLRRSYRPSHVWSLSRPVASIEYALIMQFCPLKDLLRLARCSRATLSVANNPVAWAGRLPISVDFAVLPKHFDRSLVASLPIALRWCVSPSLSFLAWHALHSATPTPACPAPPFLRSSDLDVSRTIPRLVSLHLSGTLAMALRSRSMTL